MILDSEFEFSDDQAITATAVSTNVIDLGTGRDMSAGEPVNLNIQVTEAFDNLTSLQVEVQQDADAAFSNPTVIAKSEDAALADLKPGYVFNLRHLPSNSERYLRLNYVVTGTNPTTGKVASGVVNAQQTNPNA